ncbi:MAG: DivIVA domain-containing protein [Pseudonocardiaceae bacterium]
MDRVDRKDLADAPFDVVLRGYDKRQVEERLRFFAAELIAARDAVRASAQRMAVLEGALSQAQSASGGEPAGDVQFGARVEKILTLAEDEAREVRSQAETAAVTLVDQARAEVAEARAEAENVQGSARAEADQVVTQARAEADQLVTKARAEADRLIATATDAARQQERSSAHELHQLSRLQEEINADLYRVKNLLDGLFGAGGEVPGIIGRKRRTDGAQPMHPAHTV